MPNIPNTNVNISRRTLLSLAGTATAGTLWQPQSAMSLERKPNTRPKVAVVLTIFYERSHAHVLLENFLMPYLFNGKETDSGVDVVSFYVDQFPANDMARDTAKRYGIPIYDSIDKALCLGGESLAVDAVLAIGEHGDYPSNALGQKMYPRKRFFDEITAVMKRSKRSVPIFNDKHLSYSWKQAQEMYKTSRDMKIPFLAGSSVPLAERRPPLELPAGAEITEAVSVHGGPVESYDFHGLEVLQSMVESRQGGETGITSVEFLDTARMQKAIQNGDISKSLVDAALRTEFGDDIPKDYGRVPGEDEIEPHAIRVRYKSGLKATVLRVGRKSTRWLFACNTKGNDKIHATSFYTGPWRNRNLFKALSHAIQQHFIHARAPYPVERTLMTTGILESVMRDKETPGKPLATPHLEFAYKARDYRAMREMGASWKIITESTPEPQGVNSGTPPRK
jgi:hypothetical protein